jgi:hypothetical protein
MKALAKMTPSPVPRGLQPKLSNPFWVYLPDIPPTKVLFAKDKLPDGIILPPAATGPSLNMSRPSAQTTIIPLASAYPQLQFIRHRLPISAMDFVHRNGSA